MKIGSKHWAIAEGWIPAWSHGPEPEMLSHETVCILNPNDVDAHVEITIFYSDREPVGPLSDHGARAPHAASAFQRSD